MFRHYPSCALLQVGPVEKIVQHDPITEHEIYTRLDKIAGDKSTIFISHRLSTCRFCDEIIVMDKGEIVQQGNHDELVNKSGKYRELWLAQARHYADKIDI